MPLNGFIGKRIEHKVRSMRVGIFTDTFLPQRNGVVTSICNIGKALSESGDDMVVFAPGNGLRDSGPGRLESHSIYRLRGMRFAPYPEFKVCVPTISSWLDIERIGLDVLHTKTPFPIGLVAKRLSKKFHMPIIGTLDTPIQDYVHYVPVWGGAPVTRDFLYRVARRYARWFYNLCHIVTVPSETTRGELIRAGCRKRVEVLSNGIDTGRYHPGNRRGWVRERFCPKGEALILHVGRITREKGIMELLKAAKILSGRGSRFKLVIVGRGPCLEAARETARREGISNIIFAGFVDDRDLPKYYASADFFVTASVVETQGIVLLEAMASGKPVIGANAGAIPELVRKGENGFLFAPGDSMGLAERMGELIGDGGLRKRMGEKSLKLAREHSLENIGRKIRRLYREVLSEDYWSLQKRDRGDW